MASALTPCGGSTVLFFSEVLVEQEAAKAVCQTCPYRSPCLQKALDLKAETGVWGGYDPVERKFYRRLFGPAVGAIVQPLPKSLRAQLRRNKVTEMQPPPDEAMEA